MSCEPSPKVSARPANRLPNGPRQPPKNSSDFPSDEKSKANRPSPSFPSFASVKKTSVSSRRHGNHPADAETVRDHSEARRPESFPERHRHLPAFRQRGEHLVRFGFRRNRHGKREAIEVHLFRRTTVGRHDQRFAYAKAAVHDFVFEAGREHSRLWRFGTFIVTHLQ